MGSDAAEFVSKVKDQVQTEKNVERCRVRRVEIMVATLNSDIHGKEFLNYSKFRQDF